MDKKGRSGMNNKCVHTEHCCQEHGCKYGDEDCPVVLLIKKQSFPCEECETQQNDMAPPEVVSFESEGIKCKAFVLFGRRSLNMRSCLINLDKKVKTNIDYLPDRVRVTINDGQVWFDTSEDSAAAIESLFETGKAPRKGQSIN